MRKYIVYSILSMISFLANAECSIEQNNSSIDLVIKIKSNDVKAGGNHDFMDKVIIEAPLEVVGLEISHLELTKGEVARFWIPLAFKKIGKYARTEFSGYEEEIKNFEVAAHYKGGGCYKFVQKLIY